MGRKNRSKKKKQHRKRTLRDLRPNEYPKGR
jgi:hypothetical protein